ncbi:MAG: nickel-dependent lactate racemase [Promethearchaeota archaeon]
MEGKEVIFQYGTSGLKFNIPDELDAIVLEPIEQKPLENPVEHIYKCLLQPLNSKPLNQILEKWLEKKQGNIVIVVEDHTRPMPSKPVLYAIIKLFKEININDNDVKILIGTGLHRAPTSDELRRMLGDEIINRFDIIFHNANNQNKLEYVGNTKFGTEVYLNSSYVNAGVKIITGYVEPHFFAGFSGGRKSLIPGIAGKDTILSNHSASNIHGNARFGELIGNRVHEDAVEAVKLPKAKPDFCINVLINSKHEITHVSCGNIFAVHNILVQKLNNICFKKFNHRFDIVMCGNGGAPLDLNLYQAVKSMAIGELAVKENGYIIAINECRDGVGQDSFNNLINSGKTPKQIYKDAIEGVIKVPDIWEIQILARILMKHKIFVVSSMKEDELGNIGLMYAESVEDALSKIFKEINKPLNEIKTLILPKGPQILPKIQDN